MQHKILRISIEDKLLIYIFLSMYKNQPQTYKTYKYSLTKLIVFLNYHKIKLRNFNRNIQSFFINFLYDPPDNLIGKKLKYEHPNWKPFTHRENYAGIKQYIKIINLFIADCHAMRFLCKKETPKIKIRQVNISKKLNIHEKYLTHHQWHLLLAFIEKLECKTDTQKLNYHRVRWILWLGYLTGLRASEMAKIKHKNIIRWNGKLWLEIKGKGGKIGYIPVIDKLLRELQIYREANGLSMQFKPQKDNFLIHHINDSEKNLSYQQIYQNLKVVTNKLAYSLKKSSPNDSVTFSKFSVHWLRHTYATHLAEAGLDIRMVQANMRHSMFSTTQRYIHTEKDRQYAEIQKFRLIPDCSIVK